jgi:hypothetical protein
MPGLRRLNRVLLVAVLLLTPACVALVAGNNYEDPVRVLSRSSFVPTASTNAPSPVSRP